MGRPLDDRELSKLLSAKKPAFLQTFIIIMINTMCRTQAALDLTPEQIDFEEREVRLNPRGRLQTKKHRPIVPLTQTLADHLEDKRDSPYVSIKGMSRGEFYGAWRDMLVRAKLPVDDNIVPYSIRHTMGRALRRRKVPLEAIGLYLGHKRRGAARTTAIYAPYVPDEVRDAAAVIDDYMRSL
jgi:integrase